MCDAFVWDLQMKRFVLRFKGERAWFTVLARGETEIEAKMEIIRTVNPHKVLKMEDIEVLSEEEEIAH